MSFVLWFIYHQIDSHTPVVDFIIAQVNSGKGNPLEWRKWYRSSQLANISEYEINSLQPRMWLYCEDYNNADSPGMSITRLHGYFLASRFYDSKQFLT